MNAFTIFKVRDIFLDEQLAPGSSSLVCILNKEEQCNASFDAFILLNQLLTQNVDPKVQEWLHDNQSHYKINLSNEADDMGSFVDFESKLIQLNAHDLNTTYLATDSQLQVPFSFQRLLIHEVIHAASNNDEGLPVEESIIIERTNRLLLSLGYNDQKREYEQHLERNTTRYAFIQAAPPPKPGAGFYAFFNRPTKEFVSDPWMWFSAIFSTPTLGMSAISIVKNAVRFVKPRPFYRPIPGSARQPHISRSYSIANSVSSSTGSIDSLYSSESIEASIETLSNSSEGIETASIETLSNSSESIETASIETLSNSSEDIINLSNEDMFIDSGILSYEEQQLFAERVDEEVAELSINPAEKMHMQFKLSPTAHYINQAPDIARSFIRGDISVMNLYGQIP